MIGMEGVRRTSSFVPGRKRLLGASGYGQLVRLCFSVACTSDYNSIHGSQRRERLIQLSCERYDKYISELTNQPLRYQLATGGAEIPTRPYARRR